MVRSNETNLNSSHRSGEDSAEHYLAAIHRYRPLSREEEGECAQRIRQGDQAALERLLKANLRFVVKIARQYLGRGLTLAELISEGNVGLIRAASKFDETRGFKFISYAVWWIRQAIHQGLARAKGGTTISQCNLLDCQKMKREGENLSQHLGRQATFDEVGDLLEFDQQRTARALAATMPDFSLDSPLRDEPNASDWASRTADDNDLEKSLEKKVLKDQVDRCLDRLDDREKYIVRCYFGLDGSEPMCLEQIGGRLGITRERTRQLRNRALQKINTNYGDVLLELAQ